MSSSFVPRKFKSIADKAKRLKLYTRTLWYLSLIHISFLYLLILTLSPILNFGGFLLNVNCFLLFIRNNTSFSLFLFTSTGFILIVLCTVLSVSYTHLDVYKRQIYFHTVLCKSDTWVKICKGNIHWRISLQNRVFRVITNLKDKLPSFVGIVVIQLVYQHIFVIYCTMTVSDWKPLEFVLCERYLPIRVKRLIIADVPREFSQPHNTFDWNLEDF